MAESDNQFRTLWTEVKNYFTLNIDYAKFTLAEKLTVLLTAASVCAVAFVLIAIMMFFVSMAFVRWIAEATGMVGAYFIMTGFYVLLLALVIVLRKQLIVNPISRFITKLFFK
ncbi:MAG: hypothetical protein K2H48_05315 [Duncaniella sp.]|nr:hypothetical protein [Duncaniella sp.]